MRRRLVLLALPAALALCTSQGAAALGAQTEVVADCNSHGGLTRHYSNAELRSALSTMPADVKEYTNCFDVIQRALLAGLGASSHGAGGGRSDQGSGGSFLPTPLLVALALLALAAVGFVVVAARRRAGGTAGGP